MNKKEIIQTEAKRLFGEYGYLGFTLKQLAQACKMTAPALYYFYTSKAELFRDCLLSELEARNATLNRCAEGADSLPAFARTLAYGAIDVCSASNFRTGQAMGEIIHLPQPLQEELRAAWDRLLIAPVVDFLARVQPATPPISRTLVATFLINMATFSAAKEGEYTCDNLATLFVAVARGLETLAV